MQIVLLASDGSAHADRAVAYLIGQIQQGGLLSDACAVHLLNVQPHLPSRISQGMSAEDLHAYYQGHSNDALMAAVAQLQQAGIGFTAHSRVGAPGASIVACAKELVTKRKVEPRPACRCYARPPAARGLPSTEPRKWKSQASDTSHACSP